MKQNRFGGQKRGERAQVPSPVPDKQQVAPPVEPIEDELSGDEEMKEISTRREDCFSTEEMELIDRMGRLIQEIEEGVRGAQTVETYINNSIVGHITRVVDPLINGIKKKAGRTVQGNKLKEDTVFYNRSLLTEAFSNNFQFFDRCVTEAVEGVGPTGSVWESTPDEVKAKIEDLRQTAKQLLSLLGRE